MVELRRTTPNPLAHTATDAPSRASTEELLLELRRRIIAPRDRRHESWDDWGLDPHGDWPEEGQQPHLTDPLPIYCGLRADAAVGNALTETAQLTGN